MAIVLGKRKRIIKPEDHDSSNDRDDLEDEAGARALFQRAFEAKFKPLEKTVKPTTIDSIGDDNASEISDDEAWSGLSDEETEKYVQVISLDALQTTNDQDHPWDVKDFMSSKLPSSRQKQRQEGMKLKGNQDGEDASDTANLKNDLALQRLLKESHLLDSSTFHSSDSNVQGKNRHKALDLRLQDLGAKESHLEQKKMPLSHRRGITTKSADREHRRRTEAAENGIILEKAKAALKETKARDRGIGGPSVGRFKGGTLKLSGRDLRSLESSGSAGSMRGKKGRR